MDNDQLKETFRRAAEIASVVPESMHEAAFNRALEALIGREARPTPSARRQRTSAAATSDSSDPVAALSAMDRSHAAEVDAANGTTEKSLALLLVARRELDIDGLTGAEIASVLTSKFRARATRQGVFNAMQRAGNKVDRVNQGGSVRYRIMQAGEDWLALPPEDRKSAPVRARTGRRAKSRAARASESSKLPGTAGTAQTAAATKGRSTRRSTGGPKAAVETLVERGWFESPRDLSSIRSELASSLALHFTANDLAPAMTRLLREGRLRRSKTNSGQYEYRA